MTHPEHHPAATTHRRGHTTTAALLLGAGALTLVGSWVLATDPAQSTPHQTEIQTPAPKISRTPTPSKVTPTSPAVDVSPTGDTTTGGDHHTAEEAATEFITAWRSRSWETTQEEWEGDLERTASGSLAEQLSPQEDWDSLAWERYRAGRSVTTVNVSSSTAAEDRSSTSEGTGGRVGVIVEFDVATTSGDPLEQSNPVSYRMMVGMEPTDEGFETVDVYDLSSAGGL